MIMIMISLCVGLSEINDSKFKHSINIDKFITYCNGNLIQIFQSKNITQDFLDTIKTSIMEFSILE